MRYSSQVLIFIDLEKALAAGIKFYLSANGVVLTKGNQEGVLPPEFFSRVENAKRVEVAGWRPNTPTANATTQNQVDSVNMVTNAAGMTTDA
jgi:2'-phosphotransferase